VATKQPSADSEVQHRWSDAFGRSLYSPLVFNVKKPFRKDVLNALNDAGLKTDTWTTFPGTMVSSGTVEGSATAVLDGFVIALERCWDLPLGDKLNLGMQVIGTRPLRLVCLLLGLRPPTRALKLEVNVPADTELREALAAQVALPEDRLLSLARPARGIWLGSALQDLVIELYGEEAVPDPTPWFMDRPAPNEWGKAGFTRAARKRLEEEGVSLDEATKWQQLGFEGGSVLLARRHPYDLVRQYADLGLPSYEILDYLDRGVSIATVESFAATGVPRWAIRELIRDGYTADQARSFVELGLFRAPGFRLHSLREVIRQGLTPEEYARTRAGNGG
jgi:hypothetical protein